MAKKKEEVEIPDIKRRVAVLGIRCGDCIFHKRLAIYSKPCIELGTAPAAETCHKFVVDPAVMGGAPELAAALKVLLAVPRLPALTAAAMQSRRVTERTGFAVGQPVYFRVLGGDYLGNYARGYVVGATAAGKVILAGTESFSALLAASTLLDRAAWVRKRAKLIKANRLEDPGGGLRRLSVRGAAKLVLYEPALASGKKPRKRRIAAPVPKATPGKRGPIRIN